LPASIWIFTIAATFFFAILGSLYLERSWWTGTARVTAWRLG
jgi:hypothetical protein